MTTKHFQRPSDIYIGEAGLANRTKYQDDSNASPKRPISSIKVDGDINSLFDAVNILYDTAVSGAVPDGTITLPKFAVGTFGSALVFDAAGAAKYAAAGLTGTVLVSAGAGAQPLFGQAGSAGIATGAVTNDKLATDSVSTAKIQDEAATYAKIATTAIATAASDVIAGTANKLLPASIMPPLYYGTSLSKSGVQSIPHNVSTAITYETEDYDDGNWHSTVTNTSRITVDFTGRLNVRVDVSFSITTSCIARVHIYKNGIDTGKSIGQQYFSAGSYNILNVAELNVTSGDYIEVFAYHNAGVSTNIFSNATMRRIK